MKEKNDQHNKQVNVPFLANAGGADSKAVTHWLHGCQKHSLAHAPWADTYPANPVVQFAIAYGEHGIYLQFDVEEDFIRAENGRTNDPVYQDSCVEFFISLDGGDTYYNFEFNAIGTALASYGASKQNRHFLPESLVMQIECQSTIRRFYRKPFVTWQLTVVIPFTLFYFHPSFSFIGETCKANFYKCGDQLPEPHFLCWSPVQNETPNFHLPQYFGNLVFASAEEAGRTTLLTASDVR